VANIEPPWIESKEAGGNKVGKFVYNYGNDNAGDQPEQEEMHLGIWI
jgi:hypothetical protein